MIIFKYLEAHITSDVEEDAKGQKMIFNCLSNDNDFCFQEKNQWAMLAYCLDGNLSAALLTKLKRPSLEESKAMLATFLNETKIYGEPSVEDFQFSIGRCSLLDLDDILVISLVIVLVSILIMKVALLFVK